MKSLLALTAAAAAAASMAATSDAIYRVHHSKSFNRMTAAEVRSYLHRQVWHDKTALRWLGRHPPHIRHPGGARFLLASLRSNGEMLRWSHDYQWFQTSLRIASRRLRSVQRSAVVAGIAHRALWECIHSGEGAWNAETGNGYHGGLQMTYGWGGLVQDAGLLSPDAQMAAAETGYRQSGYSRSWLAGQWPNTSPPCMAYA